MNKKIIIVAAIAAIAVVGYSINKKMKYEAKKKKEIQDVVDAVTEIQDGTSFDPHPQPSVFANAGGGLGLFGRRKKRRKATQQGNVYPGVYTNNGNYGGSGPMGGPKGSTGSGSGYSTTQYIDGY